MSDTAKIYRFCGQLIDNILKHYKDKILGDRFKEFFAEHRAKTGANHYIVGSQVFSEEGRVVPISSVRFQKGVKLHPDLYETHVQWYKDLEDYCQSSQQVLQTVYSIAARATSWQDIRDMFPEYVIKGMLSHPQLRNLERTRPDIFMGPIEDRLLHWDPQLITMYGRIGNTISVYLGYKFL